MIKKVGTFCMTFGALAIVLGFLDAVPRILIWIYLWGEGMAWVIKIALVVVGAGLFFLGSKQQVEETEEEGEKEA